jgi:hypothetical protein
MGWDYIATNGHIVHPQDDIWVWRMMVEWYWQGKTEEHREKPVPVPLCPPQISHGLTGARIRDSVVRGQQLTNRLSHGMAKLFITHILIRNNEHWTFY